MGNLIQPKTYLVGSTRMEEGMSDYLRDTDNLGFADSIRDARKDGLHDGECLISFGAKLCYKSLTLGQNANVTKVRDIKDNIAACIKAGHSSVFGHCVVNFVTTNCSRLFTHELIRHEVGTEVDVPPLGGLHEWSQTSGRYVRLERIDIAFDPILEGCEELVADHLTATEDLVYLLECKTGLRVPNPKDPTAPEWSWTTPREDGVRYEGGKWIPNDALDFDRKKKLTSAIRRVAPNGQVNEIFYSINLRALRHILQMRTARHAEWEIRLVFNQIYQLVRSKFPATFSDAKETDVDGLLEISGMRTTSYGG